MKSTKVLIESDKSSQGFVILQVFPDIVQTKIGAELYVGQTPFIVEKIEDESPTRRAITVTRKK